MAKVSEQAKNTYADRVRDYKQEIDQITQREKTVLLALDKETDPASVGFKRLAISEDCLNKAALLLHMNRVSVNLLGIKNENFLNDARKACYDAIIALEKIVTDYLDIPYSEYAEKAEAIDAFPDDKRLLLIKKLGLTIDTVEDDFGENTKWKWSFVDLEGRFAVVSKNLLNLKTIIAGMDPRVEGFDHRIRMLRIVKELLNKAADRFREKYELSTNRIDDFKMAVNFVSATRRLHLMLGESNEAEIIKKKYEVWKSKMDDDAKKQDNIKPSI